MAIIWSCCWQLLVQLCKALLTGVMGSSCLSQPSSWQKPLLKARCQQGFNRTGPHLSDLAWAIMREISRMSYNVSDSDIMRARNQLKASLLFAQDNPSGMDLLAPIC